MKTFLILLMLFYVLLFLPFSGLAATATLQWDASVPDATHGAASGYNIYKGTGSTCTQAGALTGKVATLGNVLAYTDTTVTAGQSICYEVTGTNAGGEGVHSLRVSALVPTNPPLAPLSPRLSVAP